jgi:RecB family exonuclease
MAGSITELRVAAWPGPNVDGSGPLPYIPPMVPICLRFGATHARRTSTPRPPASLVLVQTPGGRAAWRCEGLAPEVRTVEDHLTGLWARFGPGRSLPPHSALVVLAEDLLASQPLRFGWLHSLGQPERVGQELAGLLRSGAELPQNPHRAELLSALGALEHAVASEPAWVSRRVMLLGLAQRLQNPEPALARHLASLSRVVVEPLLPDGLVAHALVALLSALAQAGVSVEVHLHSPAFQGGSEVADLLGFGDEVERSRTLAVASPWRKALFEGLVGSGLARLEVGGPDGPVAVEPWSAGEGGEPPGLAEGLDGGPVHGVPPCLDLWCCSDPSEELRAVAHDVRAAVDAGLRPADAVVAVADLGARGQAMVQALEAAGISATRVGGAPLRPTAPASLLLALAQASQDLPEPSRLLPLLALAEPRAAAVCRWCRAAGVRGGRPSTWAVALKRWALLAKRELPELDILLERLDALADLVHPPDSGSSTTASAYATDLLDRARQLALPGVSTQTGQRAWGAAVAALLAVTDELEVVRSEWTHLELTRHLVRAIDEGRYQPDPDATGVAVVGTDALWGARPAALWMIGLVRGAHPARGRGTVLATAPRAAQRARGILGAVLREAESGGLGRLVLSWPAAVGTRAVAPSPVLAELLAVPIGEQTLAERVVAPPACDPVHRVPSGRVAAMLRARRGDQFGAWDGILEVPTPLGRGLAVTALDAYQACPARYGFERVFALEREQPWQPELEPRRRGEALHRILERFVDDHGAPWSGTLEQAAAALHRCGVEMLARVAAEGGVDPVMLAYAQDRWLAGLTDSRPRGLLAAWLDEERARPVGGEVLAVEAAMPPLRIGGVRLRGTLDRLDRLPGGGLLVLDYKTGHAPSRSTLESGFALQPVAYASAVSAARGEPVATAYVSLTRPDRLRRVGWTGDASVLQRAATPAEQRGALPLDAGGRAQLLQGAEQAVAELAAGRFPTTTRGPQAAGCGHCRFRTICAVDHERNRRVVCASS